MNPKILHCLALVLLFLSARPNVAGSQTNSVIEEWEKDRVATIELQIYLDFQDYSELSNYLVPDHFTARHQNLWVDSSGSGSLPNV